MREEAASSERLAASGYQFAASAESMKQEQRLPGKKNGTLQRQRWLWLVLALGCWSLAGRILYNAWFRQGTDPTWQRMQQSGVVRVCMEAAYPPFEVQDAAGHFSGYDVDLMQELAHRWSVSVE